MKEVSDATSLIVNSYIMINDESMYIKNIDSNLITVNRGQDNTLIGSHLEGDLINAITAADDELIEIGDDFGFDEERFDFGDGRIYSPRKDADV